MALGTSAIPLLFGEPFLRSLVGEFHVPFVHTPFHYASAMAFDFGVMLVVVGVGVGMITQLSEELE